MTREKNKLEDDPVKATAENFTGVDLDVNTEDVNERQELINSFTGIDISEEKTTFEIFPGMEVEEIKSLFFDKDALVEASYRIFQLNSNGHRYYYRYDEKGEPNFYPSVTTILSQTLPKSQYLIEWIAKTGLEEAEKYKEYRANYGSFMHSQFEELLINRTYDLDKLRDKLKKFIETNRLPENLIYECDSLKKDMLSFAQFVKDYDVKPLAIEIALVHPFYNYAGMIDLPCTMLEKIGGKNRISAIVDFKSGRKGFYEESEIQLHFYRELWNANFESNKIDRVFNFAPKDWRKSPTYSLKDQTDSVNGKKMLSLLDLAAIEDSKRDNVFTSVYGSISLDNDNDLSDNIISLTLSELVKSKSHRNETPDSSVSVSDKDIVSHDKKESSAIMTKKVKIVKKKINKKNTSKGTTFDQVKELIEKEPIFCLYAADELLPKDVILLKEGEDIDSRRWYSIATNIYEYPGGFLEIRGAFQSFSEMQDWKDIGVVCEVNEISSINRKIAMAIKKDQKNKSKDTKKNSKSNTRLMENNSLESKKEAKKQNLDLLSDDLENM